MSYDNPSIKDELGFKPYVKGIANLITTSSDKDLPFTIGIYGAWGAGKTSFMLQLQEIISKDIPTIWFNVWKYDRIIDIRKVLLQIMLIKFEKEAPKRKKDDYLKRIENLKKIVTTAIGNSQLSVGISVCSIKTPSLNQINNAIKETSNIVVNIEEFAKKFGEMVEAYLKITKKDKLVVFIDDLDRCLPENVINVLEGLKLFMCDSHCIFIIGIDRNMVENAIKVHYELDPNLAGREYLDKIVQYPVNVPTPCDSILKNNFKNFDIKEIINTECQRIFNIAAEQNPRVYQRLLRTWDIYSSIARFACAELLKDDNKYLLAIAVMIHIRFPKMHEVCKLHIEGLITLLRWAVSTELRNVEEILDKNGLSDFIGFWKNDEIRRILKKLDYNSERLAKIADSKELFEEAFCLFAK